MPRTARAVVAGGCYHVINRGNNRSTVFFSATEYDAFISLMADARERIPVDLLAVCLMPNHFHLVAMPRHKDDLGRWVHWLLTTHGQHHHRRHQSCGRIWQGRYKAFPIERDEHLLSVMRYVERNALRAGLVSRAEHWPWSSLAWRTRAEKHHLLAATPVVLPVDWTARVNAPQAVDEEEALRACVNRQRPFGSENWIAATAGVFGLEATLRPRGRPRRVREPIQ